LESLRVFHLFEKSLKFSPGQVAHYNKTTLKNLCIFHQKSSCFFTWAGHPLQWDHHFEKSSYFSSL
jgi:hypothetical protein